jgi:D-arginine dehydrogenase
VPAPRLAAPQKTDVIMTYDFVIIGAGISGASAAYHLAQSGSVILIEAESAPGYHSTGRSAALYTRNFGGPVVRRINSASHSFFMTPPDGFSERPLLTPRGALAVAAPGEEDKLDPILNLSVAGNEIEKITAAKALELAPLLRPERVAAGAWESGVMDMDVAALHQGFLRGVKRSGGLLVSGRRVERLDRRDGLWRITAGDAVIEGRTIVNAAGAWADQVGGMAGAAPIGLVPKRRTAIIIDAPPGADIGAMPAVEYAGCPAYFKPDAGRIMASLGDETPVAAQDVQPDEMDVALLADWLQRETLLTVTRIEHSWAGLRSFVPDEAPVVGLDAIAPDFFWLAGQGGYGIMMAPALGRATASLIVSGSLPADLREGGLCEKDISPSRLN